MICACVQPTGETRTPLPWMNGLSTVWCSRARCVAQRCAAECACHTQCPQSRLVTSVCAHARPPPATGNSRDGNVAVNNAQSVGVWRQSSNWCCRLRCRCIGSSGLNARSYRARPAYGRVVIQAGRNDVQKKKNTVVQVPRANRRGHGDLLPRPPRVTQGPLLRLSPAVRFWPVSTQRKQLPPAAPCPHINKRRPNSAPARWLAGCTPNT
jgi:hypothetical protein